MMSWTDEAQGFGKPIGRSGSNCSPKAPAGGPLGTIGSLRRSLDYPAAGGSGSPGSSFAGSPGKHMSPLVKEGKRFDGWSHLVDNNHLNTPADPEARPAPAPAVPLKSTVGFDPAAAVAADEDQPVVAAAHLQGTGAPPAGADAKGWWHKMDQGALNQRAEAEAQAAAAVGSPGKGSFTPQYGFGQKKDLDWGSSTTTSSGAQ